MRGTEGVVSPQFPLLILPYEIERGEMGGVVNSVRTLFVCFISFGLQFIRSIQLHEILTSFLFDQRSNPFIKLFFFLENLIVKTRHDNNLNSTVFTTLGIQGESNRRLISLGSILWCYYYNNSSEYPFDHS